MKLYKKIFALLLALLISASLLCGCSLNSDENKAEYVKVIANMYHCLNNAELGDFDSCLPDHIWDYYESERGYSRDDIKAIYDESFSDYYLYQPDEYDPNIAEKYTNVKASRPTADAKDVIMDLLVNSCGMDESEVDKIVEVRYGDASIAETVGTNIEWLILIDGEWYAYNMILIMAFVVG